MSKRNTSKIMIIVPHGVRIQIIRKKKSINGNRIKTIKPYYLNTSLVDENGEPLVERDFEGYYSILEDIKNDEEEYFDNMPENLQGSMRGMDSEEAISNMDDALEVLEQAIDENDQDILLDLLAEAADLIETAAV